MYVAYFGYDPILSTATVPHGDQLTAPRTLAQGLMDPSIGEIISWE